MERNVLRNRKPANAKPGKRRPGPRRQTHCGNKACRGVLETICVRMQFGAKKFGLKRRMMMRQCVKCGNRYIDGICMMKNEAETSKYDKILTRKRVEEGLLELDDKGKIVWNQASKVDEELW